MHIENTGLTVKNVSGIPGKSARNPKYCGKAKSFASAKGCVATPSGCPAGGGGLFLNKRGPVPYSGWSECNFTLFCDWLV